MLSAEKIKSIAIGLGADQCGIAGTDRFHGAPDGFRPTDIWIQCRSVIVFLKHMPYEVLHAGNPVVYTHTANILYDALDEIGINLCFELEKYGIRAIPVPTDVPYLAWDAENMHGKGILSMRHAAYNAGLGILGRNTLLINRDLGNMVYIGAILVGATIDADPIVTDLTCAADCNICIEACPVKALDGVTVNQQRCRKFSTLEHPRGWDIYTCSKCRQACPLSTGN